MLKILIADDEAPARNRLKDLLSDIGDIEICGEAKNGREVVELAAQLTPDIVLLDIRMPQMDGIEAAKHLQTLAHPPAVIFTTAYDTHAITAFEMNAVDYLLKPIRLERLHTALLKASKLLPQQLTEIDKLSPRKTHLSISERGRILLVPVTDIIYLRAELKYVTVRTAEREYLLEASLTQLEQEFTDTFIRLHRNCLVAPAFIHGYEKRHVEGHQEKQWVAMLKHVPETVTVSRRQQHLIRHTP